MKRWILALALTFCSFLILAPIAVQITDFQDGNVLTAGQLNNEFGNIYSTINNLDEDNFAPGAALPPSLIDSSIAGPGLERNPSTGVLNVDVDDSTIEIVTNTLQVKPDGITASQIATGAVGTDEIANNAVTSAKIPDNAIGATEIAAGAVGASEIAANAVGSSELANNAVDTAAIQDGAVTRAKTVDLTVATGSGNSNNVVYGASIGGTIECNDPLPPTCIQDAITGTATFTSQGSAVMVQMAPAFGGGDAYLRCGKDRNADLYVRLQVNGSDVAVWQHRMTTNESGSFMTGVHDFYASHTYIHGTAAGTNTYRYVLDAQGGSTQGNFCSYGNIAVAVYEL